MEEEAGPVYIRWKLCAAGILQEKNFYRYSTDVICIINHVDISYWQSVAYWDIFVAYVLFLFFVFLESCKCSRRQSYVRIRIFQSSPQLHTFACAINYKITCIVINLLKAIWSQVRPPWAVRAPAPNVFSYGCLTLSIPNQSSFLNITDIKTASGSSV